MNYNTKTFLLLSMISLMILGGCVVEPLPHPRPYHVPAYSPVIYESYSYTPYYGAYYGPYHGPYRGWGHHHHWR